MVDEEHTSKDEDATMHVPIGGSCTELARGTKALPRFLDIKVFEPLFNLM